MFCPSPIFWLSLKHDCVLVTMMMLRLEPLLVPMGNSRGGGVGLLFEDTLQTKVTSHADTFKILELIDIHF